MSNERYIFTAEGHGNVIKAYDSIAAAAEKAGERVDKAFTGSLRGPRAGGTGAAARGPGGQSASRRRAAEQRELAQFERRLQREIKAEERAEQRKTQAAQRETAKRARIETQEKQRAARAQERETAKQNRAHERETQQRRKRIEAAEKKELRDLERKLAKEQRAEERAAKAVVRAKETAASKAKRDRAARSSARWGLARDAAFGMAGAALAGGTAVVGRAITEGVDLQDRATRLAIQGGDPSQAKSLREGFEQTAVGVRGSKASDIAGGVEAFVTKTGDLGMAREFQTLMAEMSVATGATATDLGDAMADLFQKFDIKTVDEMSKSMAILAVQGKNGAFELKDAAAQYPKLAAAAQRLGIGKGSQAVSVLGGLTQIARTSTGSPEQAATALEATFRQLTSKAPELKRKGVNVFDKKGNARDIRDVLVETIGKVGGKNIEQKKVGLQKIFGEEGIRAVSPLISEFAAATGEGKDGLAAMREMIDRAINTVGAEEEMRRDLTAAQQTAGASLTGAWETLKAAISSKATPAFVELAGKLADVAVDMDFDALGTGAVAVAEAFALIVDAAASVADVFGFERKQDPPELRAAKAQDKIESLTARRDAILKRNNATDFHYLPDADRKTYDKLTGQIGSERTTLSVANKELDAAQGHLQGNVSKKDFIEQYTALGADPDSARRVAENIASDPVGYNTSSITHAMNTAGGGEAADNLIKSFVESQVLQNNESKAAERAAADAEAAERARAFGASLAQAAAAADNFRPGDGKATSWWN